jgi:hypothetical protein
VGSTESAVERLETQNFDLAIAPELSVAIGRFRIESVGSEVSMFRYSAADLVGNLNNQSLVYIADLVGMTNAVRRPKTSAPSKESRH